MKRNNNWKNSDFNDFDYLPLEKDNKYYKNNYKLNKATKTNIFGDKNSIKHKKCQKDKYYNNYNNSSKYNENDMKYYTNPKKFYSNGYNNDEQKNFSFYKNNDFYNYEKSKNNKKNENEFENEKNEKNDEKMNKNYFENILDEEKKNNEDDKNEKSKKLGIKSIPHPKRKKNKGYSYISGKKNKEIKQKIDDENNLKKERKISISSNQNNFDSAKHSVSTLNTSSSSYKEKEKEKDVLTEETIYIIENNENKNNKKILKNKFDENIETEVCLPPVNKYLENTEILKVNVKLSKNETIIFKLRRFDDLFLTIKLFCEINSIDEKFIKPLIIKSLCTLNLIYQVYNSQISNENISVLKIIKNLDDIQQ